MKGNESHQRIGSYHLHEQLGQGGMGSVYRATDERLGRDVALKLLRPEFADSDAAQSRLEREALAAARLDHPGLCKVYEIGSSNDALYIAMPLHAGATLSERIGSEQSVDPEWVRQAVTWIAKSARALHHAHEANLLHLDIKPHNILIGDNAEPIILDFGLARSPGRDDELTGLSRNAGTPLYMSPEQIAGASGSALSHQTDIYALGATLFEALTGQPPFEGRSMIELELRIRTDATPDPRSFNRQVSRDLSTIVAVATAKRPDDRYASCEALADDLERVLRDEPVIAQPPSTMTRCQRWVRRNRMASAAILALLAALFGASLMWRSNHRLSSQLALTAASLTEQRQQVSLEQKVADRRLHRFERLAVEDRLKEARRGLQELGPAWPENAAAIQRWVESCDEELRPELKQLDDAIDTLLVSTTAAGTTLHAPDLEVTTRIGLRLDVLQAAQAVRNGLAEPAAAPESGPEEARLPINIYGSRAQRFCDVYRGPADWGLETWCLAQLDRALAAKAAPRYGFLVNRAWACSALGLEARARSAMNDAIAAAPPDLHSDLEQELRLLEGSVDEATADRQRLEQLHDELNKAASRPPRPQFENDGDAVLYATLSLLRTNLYELLRPEGPAERVADALRWSQTVAGLTKNHPHAHANWREAAEAIQAADGHVASELYAAQPFELRPQIGLVPIGKNPVTGLWEFYHLRSALDHADPDAARQLTIPKHAADGSLDLDASSGIVFVLLPGSRYSMGSQDKYPGLGAYDPWREINETAMEDVIEPFFLARHELTQSQWLRLSTADDFAAAARNPSRMRAGDVLYGRWVSRRHPVETVSFYECAALLHQHGLRLPSQFEWEYSCRSNTLSPWSCGATPADLEHHANVLDAATSGIPGWTTQRAAFSDGHIFHAPVGSFRSNPFGFYDMHGNVAELCSDWADFAQQAVTIRGGSFRDTPTRTRSAWRGWIAPSERGEAVGLRACRELKR